MKPFPAGPKWEIQYLSGSVGELHGRELPEDGRRHAWLMKPTAAALVLGSTQDDQSLDTAALEKHAIEVVRRRSGGGAVLLTPVTTTWIDFIIPVGDSAWSDDVGQAMYPIGEIWQAALGNLGVPSVVHRGGMQHSSWSRHICFAGIGAGEVLDSQGKKLVGISQRRTRIGARFQTVMYHADPTSEMLEFLDLPPAELHSLQAVLRSTAGFSGLSQEALEHELKSVLGLFELR